MRSFTHQCIISWVERDENRESSLTHDSSDGKRVMLDLLESVDFDVETDDRNIFAADIRMAESECWIVSVFWNRVGHCDGHDSRDNCTRILEKKDKCGVGGGVGEWGGGGEVTHVFVSFLSSLASLLISSRQRESASYHVHQRRTLDVRKVERRHDQSDHQEC